jgi:hypothetical protein
MRHKLLICATLVCTLVLLTTVETFSQNKRVGTAGANELLIPTGGRDLAMGGSTVANSIGVESIYWNPAGLGRLQPSAEAMFSTMTWIGDIGVSFGAVGAKFGDFGNIGFSVKSISFGDIPLTTDDDPEGRSGRVFSPTFVVLGLSYARSLTDAISVGGTFKIVSEQIDRVSASGLALDFGVQYTKLAGISGLMLGLAVKNIGPQIAFDGSGLLRTATSPEGRRQQQKYKTESAGFELPSSVEIGLSYSSTVSDKMDYTVGGSFGNNNLYLDEFRLGGEAAYKMNELTFFGRLGGSFIPQASTLGADSEASEKENIFGPSFGLGLKYVTGGIDLTVDWAYRVVEFFDANQVVSVKFGF